MSTNNETQVLNLYQRLAKIRQISEVIRKNRSGYGYKYVSLDEIQAKVAPGLAKYHVSLIPKPDLIVDQIKSVTTKKDKAGNPYEEIKMEFMATGTVTFIWVCDEDPDDRIEIVWPAAATQSDPAQAIGAAITYAERYFLLYWFMIATPENDPEEWISKKREAAASEDREALEAVINEISLLVSNYLEGIDEAGLKDARAKIGTAVKKYARTDDGKPSQDFRRIKDLNAAIELMNELNKITGGNAQ